MTAIIFSKTRLRTLLCGIFFLLASLLSSPALAAGPLLLGESSAYDLTGHIELLKDPTLKMGFQEVLKARENGRFRSLEGNLNNGYKREACWVRFTVERNASFPEASWLRLKPNYINELTLYIQRPGSDPELASSYHVVPLGNHIPALQRPVLHPDFVVPLVLPTSEPLIIYARVFSKSSISFAGRVHTTEDLRDFTNQHIILQSLFLGITLTLLVINIIFYLLIRDTLFLYYSFYLLAGILFNFAAEGSLTLLFPSFVHIVSDYLVYGGIGANILVYSEFSRKLFFPVASVWSLRYMRLLSLVGFLTITAVPFGFYPSIAPIAFIGTLSLVVVQMVLSVRLGRSLPGIGIFIVLAFAVSTLGYFHMLLRLMGILPLGFFWDTNTLQFTSLIHMILISVALSERIRRSERILAESARRELDAAKETERRAVELANTMTVELRNSKNLLEIAFASEQQALRQQHRFLSMLSHEYRTPLAVISGNLDIIDKLKEESQCEYDEELTAIHHAVERLVEVMEVSLERNRLTEPGTQGESERIAIAPFLSEKVRHIQAMWPLHTFHYTEASESMSIVGYPQNLKTALFNLLDNARKYSPQASPVEVESRIDGAEVVITIKNQGEPFTPEEGEAFFDKYSRGSNTNTSGAGVGLWLVRQIIQQHHGQVMLEFAESRICATVRLPLVAETEEDQDIQTSQNSQKASS
ncbi:MAG: sensor histidine kinase [Chlorobium sp.]